MSLFKIFKGKAKNLTNTVKENGNMYFTTDTKELYIDHSEDGKEITRSQVRARQLTTPVNMTINTFCPETTTSFDGSKDIAFNIPSCYGSLVNWNGPSKRCYDSAIEYSETDCALLDCLHTNKLAFLPQECVDYEYSIDGGQTWSPLEMPEKDHKRLFCANGSTFEHININPTGLTEPEDKVKCQLRITLHSSAGIWEGKFSKFFIYISTKGSLNCWVSLDILLNKDIKNDVWTSRISKQYIDGWPGWNVLNIEGQNQTLTKASPNLYQVVKFRFTFGCDSCPRVGTDILTLNSIAGFGPGPMGYYPSNLAKFNHLYSYDYLQNCTFPGNISTSGDITASKIFGLSEKASALEWDYF